MHANVQLSPITIREATEKDALQTLTLQRDVISEGKYLILEDFEFTRTIEQQIVLIQQTLKNNRETFIVAERDDEILGLIIFQSPSKEKMNHTGTFGLIIKREHREKGLGKLLLKELLDWAIVNPNIEKVCLSVFSNNKRAIALYRSLGFKEEGRKVKAFKLSNGKYIDDILMYTLVST